MFIYHIYVYVLYILYICIDIDIDLCIDLSIYPSIPRHVLRRSRDSSVCVCVCVCVCMCLCVSVFINTRIYTISYTLTVVNISFFHRLILFKVQSCVNVNGRDRKEDPAQQEKKFFTDGKTFEAIV